jgi:PAS domain S-box-containing protein
MRYRSDICLVNRIRSFAALAPVLCAAVAVSVLAGWALHTPVLTTWGAGVAMVPSTAACILLASLSLWLLRSKDQSQQPARKLVANTAIGIFSLLALFSLLGHLFGLNLSVHPLGLSPLSSTQTAAPLAFMSPTTAATFLFLGCAFIIIDWCPPKKPWPSQFFCLAAATTTMIGLFGLMLGSRVSSVGLISPAPAVAAFFLLNGGLLCSRPTWALGGLVTRHSQGAEWLRRTLPFAALLFAITGWVIAKPLLSNVHFTWTEIALLALSAACMLTLFIGWVVYMMDRSETIGSEQPLALQPHSGPSLDLRQEPEAEIRLRHWVKFSGVTAVLLMSLLGLLSWHMAQQAQRDAVWVTHTHQASAALQLTLRHLVDTETGARGFFLTGQANFLEPYETGRRAVLVDMPALRKLIVDPDQQRRLDLLDQRVALKLALMFSLVGVKQQSGVNPSLTQLVQSKQLMDQVRATVDEIETAESRLLTQRTQRARATRNLTTTAVGLGSVFGVIFLSIAGITVHRELGVSARARASVKTLNAELEQRVELRTAELQSRTAELQSEISARITNEKKLKNQAALLELADDAILVRDLENRVVFFNKAAQDMYGLSREEASGRVSHELLQTKFPLPLADVEKALADTGSWQGELRHSTRHGDEVVVASRWTLQRDNQGAPMAILEINRDITERKQHEEQLAAQAEELRVSRQALEEKTFILQSVLDSMIEGLVAADQHGNFILWNEAAEKIVGRGATKLPPREWSAHYQVYTADMVTPIGPGEGPLERALRGETSSTEIILHNPELDRQVWLEINSSPLRSKDGALRGGVSAFRDITQRKTDEIEIRKLNEELEIRIARRTAQLEAANQELEAFSYSVSHDLRSPLRHIAGFSRILVNEFGARMDSEARAHLQSIESAVDRMGQLIDGLLKMATLGRHALRPRHTELNPIVDEIVSQLQPECAGREVEWRITPLPTLECDPVLMRQVLQNLLHNALKYTRGRSRAIIEVNSIQQDGQPPVIFVRDNGAGFDLKYAEKLFGVFQRFHSKNEFEGTGVGLATVYRILQKHGGTIWAEAEVNQGATFYFATQPVTDQAGITAYAAPAGART